MAVQRIRVNADGLCGSCCACLNSCAQVTGAEPGLFLVRLGGMVTPVVCRHCENAPCVDICVTQALSHLNALVVFERERCIGCGLCVLACPFGAIEMNRAGEPVKCNGCAPLQNPACVSACPRGILSLKEI